MIRPPVSSVVLSGAPLGSTLTLNLGQSVTLTATPMSPAGDALTDRPVSWSTTNSRVVTITSAKNGTAVVKAVGGGAASVTAASEGKASQKLNVIVISPCCQVGDGAPPVVQQSFRDALTRNKISRAATDSQPGGARGQRVYTNGAVRRLGRQPISWRSPIRSGPPMWWGAPCWPPGSRWAAPAARWAIR